MADYGSNAPRRAMPVDDEDFRAPIEPDHARSRPGRPRRAHDEHGPGHPFSRSLGATLASAIIPGSGLMSSRSRAVQFLGALTSVAALALGLYVFVQVQTNLSRFAGLVVSPSRLRLLSGSLIVGGLLWVTLIVGTHLVTRPRRIDGTQRLVGAIVVGGLSLAVGAPVAVASRYAIDQAGLVDGVFTKKDDTRSETRPDLQGADPVDVWKSKPRLNVLLLGSDASKERSQRFEDRANGDLLTDTIMMASIDTATGNITMVQIPRNMARLPFPPGTRIHEHFPDGFWDGRSGENDEFFVNNVWYTVQRDHADAYPNSTYAGGEALKEGIGQALGLDIDYFLMIDIDGIQNLIDSVGGITVNINKRLPIGGSHNPPRKPSGYLEPGPNRHLNGYEGMWYARSRYDTDDYDRMARQTCTVNAILQEANPANVVQRFEAIAGASKQMVTSDIPQEALPAFIELALRVKDGKMNRLLFENGKRGFVPWNPDYDLMRKQVAAAIAEASGQKPTHAASPSPTASPSVTRKPTKKPTSSATATASSSAKSENVDDACAYHPEDP